MSEVQLLKNKLAPLLNWHGARIDFLARFLIAIIKVSTVNLTHIAAAFSGKAETDSNYKRIYRFLKDFAVDFDLIASIIARIFLPPGEKWLLTIDRSNWKFGKKNINFLVLGVAYKGMAIPLFWSLLPKRGNSNAEERLSKLFALVAIAACWAHKAGELKNERKPIKIKKHKRKAKSIFRCGLDHIKSILNNILEQHIEFISVLKLLSGT